MVHTPQGLPPPNNHLWLTMMGPPCQRYLLLVGLSSALSAPAPNKTKLTWRLSPLSLSDFCVKQLTLSGTTQFLLAAHTIFIVISYLTFDCLILFI